VKRSRPTFWQRLDRAPWWIKTLQFWIVGIASTFLFVSLGFDERIAGLAGLIGMNIAVFLTVAFLADQDDKA
jgi:hypothetical protein